MSVEVDLTIYLSGSSPQPTPVVSETNSSAKKEQLSYVYLNIRNDPTFIGSSLCSEIVSSVRCN